MFNSMNCGGYSLSDIAAVNGRNNDNDGFGGNGAWWIIILFLFVFCGWGNRGWGNGNGDNGGSSALTRGELCQDMNFADVEGAVRGVQSGLCDGFYAMNTGMLNGFSGLQNQLCGEFRTVDNAICTLGYQTQQGVNSINVANMQNTNALQTQISDCCCKTQSNIKDAVTQGVMNTNALQAQIKDCCCDVEKMNMQNRFDAAQANCAVLQAIDRVGDRVIDYLAADKAQTLRDENQTLRLAASQAAQNNYLVSQLRPSPVPSYNVPNPYCCYGNNFASYNNGCGCGYAC